MRVLNEARGLIARGHDVRIVTPGHNRLTREARALGVQTVDLPIRDKKWEGLRAMRRWLHAHAGSIDIVNTHSSTDAWLTAIAALALRDMPPVVRTRHVSTPISNKPTSRWLYKRAVRHIVTTGEALRRTMHRENGIALDRMTSVPTGVDLDRFKPGDRAEARKRHGLSDEFYWVGILAMLSHFKGHRDLFAMMALFARTHPEIRLLVLGDGPERRSMEAEVKAANLQDRIRFVGYVSDAESWLPALDVFAHPSTGDEGVSQSLMQAMCCALPCVATAAGSLSDLVIDERTGLMVPPGSPQALADAVLRLRADDELARSIGEGGRAHVLAHFGYEAMLDAMERIFLEYARPERVSKGGDR